ncbi:MAG: hypothetical protein HRU39_02285 [Salinicola sp.]|uniref:DUF6708 domain-containing protein n=1 Tax=Salinicola sp. TaxID=1978524 RepID=UPI001DDE418F|nr:DUF6708 domain-containing protein [Salinicola sp.]NRB54799.1 hypothetical protein [Salinicola sp.]
MDYSGFGSRGKFHTNRLLTDAERLACYQQKDAKHAQPMDFLSVIKLNSNYIDLVDRWYPVRGFWAWLSVMLGCGSLVVSGALLYAIIFPLDDPMIAGLVAKMLFALLSLMFFLFAWFGAWYAFKAECLGYTHYPIRLNRNTRKVHFFRQNGTVLTVPWDSLFLTLGQSKSPLVGTTYDLRAHVLDDDGETVRESFSLGYTFPGKPESMNKFWAFLQPYMEAEDGVERTHQELKKSLLMPVDGRREGWRWSVFRTFAPGLHYPWTMLLLCIPLGLNAVGRMLAMNTSKIPQWPEEVERANPEEPDDPYRLTWRDNGPLGWWELYWPLLCTVIGVGAFVGALGWIVSGLWR